MKKILPAFSIMLLSIPLLIGGCIQQPTQRSLTPDEISARAQQSAKIHTELAAEYYNRRQLKVAIEEVNEALQAVSNYAPAYNVFGLIYMALREDKLAQDNFERALKISPKDSEVQNNYGWFLCQRFPERMEQAIGHFMTALSDPLYSTPEKSYTNAGICELKRGNHINAATYFHKALSIRSAYPPAVIGLIEVDFRSGNIETAKAKLLRYMQRSSPTPDSLWLAIQIERKIGDQHAEDSYMHQLQKHFPNSEEAAALRQGRFK